MSVTITLDDTTAANLRAALAGGTPAPTPSPSPAPSPAPTPAKQISYPVAKLTAADKVYLWRVEVLKVYALALKALPGSHQIFFDLLVDNLGHRWSDATPQPAGTTNSPFLKQQISQAINAGASDPTEPTFKIADYTGPLKEIMANLIEAKLAGKA